MNTLISPVLLDGRSLNLGLLEEIALGRPAALDPEVLPAVRASRKVVDDLLARGEVAYGLNTGFGRLANRRIEPDQVRELQRNLILSHCAGMGPYLPDRAVRAMIALRVNALAQGFSGVRVELLEALLALLHHGIHPRVPSRGSVGASGDLAPLSHIALALLGEGEVSWQGRVVPAAEALAAEGLSPVVLEAKEGLALINGTQLMTALGSLTLARAGRLMRCADVIGGMSVEALMGTDANLHPLLHAARPHPGQLAVAETLRRALASSPAIASHRDCPRVQDAYSLRCMPQVHGAAREGWRFATEILQREMNSVTDNPLVFPDSGQVVSGGNFHGAPVALALDAAAVALATLGTISERRCDRLLAGQDGLPSFLAVNPGLHSGLMIVQYTAAALVNENKVLAHPASVDTVPTSAGQEDHNSHGPTAAHKLEQLVSNLERILACEWVCAGQALENRRPLRFGPGTEAGLAVLRRVVPVLEGDRPPHGDLEAARSLLEDGTLWSEIQEVLGPLP